MRVHSLLLLVTLDNSKIVAVTTKHTIFCCNRNNCNIIFFSSQAKNIYFYVLAFDKNQRSIKRCVVWRVWCVLLFYFRIYRWKSGVASSLNYINIDSTETNPKLIPYPSWNSNSLQSDGFSATADGTAGGRTNAPKATVVDGQLADNSSIISTFRIRVDECDRLWVMDTGLVDILQAPKQIAPPALVIFDLKTNKLIKRYTIPGAHIKDDTFFANVVRFFYEIHQKQCQNQNSFQWNSLRTTIFRLKLIEEWTILCFYDERANKNCPHTYFSLSLYFFLTFSGHI